MDDFLLRQHQLLSFAVRCCLKPESNLDQNNTCDGQTAPFLLSSCTDIRKLHLPSYFGLRHKSKLLKLAWDRWGIFCFGRNNQTCSFWITDIISYYCQESQSHFVPAKGEIFTNPSEAEASSPQRPRYGNHMLITVNTSAGSHTLD